MPTQEQEIEKILSELEGLQEEISDLRKQRDAALLRNSNALSNIEDRFEDLDSWVNVIHTLQDIPGLRVPKWYTVEVPFTFGDKQSRFNSTQISATGPFVCTQMQAYYRITDTTDSHYTPDTDTLPPDYPVSTAAGRIVEPTAYNATVFRYAHTYKFAWAAPGIFPYEPIGDLFSSYTAPPLNFYRGDGWNYPDFDVSIELANSNRLWTGRQKIPSAALYGVYGPLHLGAPGVVAPADSVVVHAQPTTDSVHLTGVFTLVMHGYQICAHVNPEMLEEM